MAIEANSGETVGIFTEAGALPAGGVAGAHIGVHVEDAAGAQLLARTTAGVGEIDPGVYAKADLVVPTVGAKTRALLIWDDDRDGSRATEDLVIYPPSSPAPIPPGPSATYAAVGDLVAYAEGTAYAGRLPATDLEKLRLIELCERDVDLALGRGERTEGLLYGGEEIAELTPDQRAALSRATCAQALYRIEMGDEHFVRAQRERVSGRGFSREGKLPIVGPEVYRELAFTDLQRLSTHTGGRGSMGPNTARWLRDE